MFVGNNKLTYNTYTILHSNNYSSYALPLSGGTITGNLAVRGYIYLRDNNKCLYTSDTADNVQNTLVLDGNNHLLIGYGTAGSGYNTYLHGNNLYLRYGTSRTVGITLSSSGSTTFAGTIEAKSNAYSYTTDATSYGLNMHNSDIVNVNSIYTSDKSDGWTEAISFKRTNGNWDTFRASDGLFYFGHDNGTESCVILSQGAGMQNGYRIYGSDYIIGFEIGTGNTNRGIFDYTSSVNKWLIYFNASNTILDYGNVGIGTASPSYKLHVQGTVGMTTANQGTMRFLAASSINYIQSGNAAFNGNINMVIGGYNGTTAGTLTLGFSSVVGKGEITAQSDERKKNIISNTKFNVKDIASARSIIYEWNDDRDKDNEKKIHGGSIAQDWLGKADSFLSQDNDGFYSINYGALALCSAITIAREVVKHEDRITLLEKENAKLKARVAELEERRIA